MKYNRFAVLKKLTDKNSNSKIKIPFRLAIFVGALSVVSTGVSLISPYLYKLLVDNVMTNGNLSLLYYIIPAMVGVFVAGVIISALSTYFSTKFSVKVDLATKEKIFNKLINQDIADVANPDVGNLQKLTEQDSTAVSAFITTQIIGFFCAFLFAAIYLVLMLLINPWLTLASVVFIPIAILFSRYTGKMFNKYNNELWQIGSKNNTFLFDNIQKWREVKANNLQNSLVEEYKKKLKPEVVINLKWMKYFALDNMFYDFKNKFVQSLLLYLLGGMFIIWGQITIGSLLMFMSYMSSLSGNVDAIISSITGFSGNKAVFDRILQILDQQEKDREDIKLTCFNIGLKNVSFSYGEGLPCVLNNVSYNFKYGKKYLVVGKSGEGKSTLIKLLLSLIKPIDGKIQINDIDFESIKKQNIFKGIGTVMQENQFFNLSIKDNLKLIAPDATDDEIREAAKIALIDEFMELLPEKYDSVIGERGIKLSGGQKQRLAIARMILHKPQVAILDEATSSLDAVTERQILSNLNDFFKGKTLIIISHKPALEIKFDKKIIVENEMILETVV